LSCRCQYGNHPAFQLSRKKNVGSLFYPKDGTPVCTREVIDFSDHEDHFSECDIGGDGVRDDQGQPGMKNSR
jgi:peroxiredoxin